MKPESSYNDLMGEISVDISFKVAGANKSLKNVGKYFKLDEERFKLISIRVSGIKKFCVSLICVDKTKSNLDKDYIVELIYSKKEFVLEDLFEDIDILLLDSTTHTNVHLKINEEAQFSDFHGID